MRSIAGRQAEGQVGAVGRQVAQFGAAFLDCLGDAVDLVSRQVVHDDDVAGRERGGEELLDPGTEQLAGHGAVDHAGRVDAVVSEAGDEGCGLPVAVGHAHDETLPAWAPTIAARHLGGGAGLVDEDQALRAQFALLLAPSLACCGDVGALLLSGVRCLFLRVSPRAFR